MNLQNKKELRDVNDEEAWLHWVMMDFNYIVKSGKYGPLFYDLLDEETKTIINNMREVELGNVEIKWTSQLDL
jgi:hypothetical protein